MSRQPISVIMKGKSGISLGGGRTINVQVPSTALCLVWMSACSMQLVLSPFETFGPQASGLRSRTYDNASYHGEGSRKDI